MSMARAADGGWAPRTSATPVAALHAKRSSGARVAAHAPRGDARSCGRAGRLLGGLLLSGEGDIDLTQVGEDRRWERLTGVSTPLAPSGAPDAPVGLLLLVDCARLLPRGLDACSTPG